MAALIAISVGLLIAIGAGVATARLFIRATKTARPERPEPEPSHRRS